MHKRRALEWVVGVVVAFGAIGMSGCEDRTIEVSLDAGLKQHDIRVGRGPTAKKGNLVEVRYVGRLPSGETIIDTRGKGASHHFFIGDGTVIPGMDKAVRGMRTGGVRHVTLPPNSHYGRKGYGGVVPADTVLTFEVEMIRVERATGARAAVDR